MRAHPSFSKRVANTKRYISVRVMVARRRFELPSEAPEASMIDRYTTGLKILFSLRSGFDIDWILRNKVSVACGFQMWILVTLL
jgi:hypothetical protein